MHPSTEVPRREGGQVVRAGAMLFVGLLASRLLGVGRDVVISAQFGTSGDLDLYIAAFRIPDLIFTLISGGALGSALVPVFARAWNGGADGVPPDPDYLDRLARAVLTAVTLIASAGALTAMLLLCLFPVITFAVRFAQGQRFTALELAGAALVVGALAVWSLPRLDKHVANARGQNMTFAIRGVWADNNHRLALAMSFAMMFAAFTVIPYITIYMQANHILLPTEIPFIYLAGGIVTLLSARWIGTLTDRIGKREMFQRMLLLSMVPMTLTTLMQPYALPVVLLVSASLFFFMNARMIPGMAFLTSAAQPQFRGAFMSLNGAVQSLSIGIATWIGGVLIQRNPQGQVTHYWMCAVAGIAASVVAYWLAQRVKIHTIEPQAPAA